MRDHTNLKTISDVELLGRLTRHVSASRRVEADLVADIAEVDERRLYAREAAPSMYAYCTERLHLSEAEAWLRIRVARASRKHPMILPMLRDGRLHLSGIVVLVPHLTSGNRDSLLKRAVHKTRRQVEELVAEVAPREDVPARMRKLPARRGQAAPAPAPGLSPETVEGANSQLTPETVGGPDAAALPAHEIPADEGAPAALQLTPDAVAPPSARSTRVEPLSPARFKVQFTADEELHDMLERLQALMRSSVPDGDLAAVLKVAVAEKLERLEARRFAKTSKPRKSLADTDPTPTSRHIPAPVRRAVHERDGGRCTYVDARGSRCRARERLEFHHHGTPFGRGGDHTVGNVRLACRTHNTLMAEQDYGKEKMARVRRPASRVSEAVVVYGVAAVPRGPVSPPG